MVDGKRKFQLSTDVLGGILFTLSSFPLVLVVMGIFRDPGTGGAASAAGWVVGWLGQGAPVLWSGGFALVGMAMVLGNESFPVRRTLLGISGTAIGLTVLLGALTADGGGRFGSLTGGAVADSLSEPLAIFIGVVCVLAPIWFTWLRGLISENSTGEEPDNDALSDTDGGSVSSEEAALLVPDEPSKEYLEDVWREVRNAERPPTLAPSPYPVDPRLSGAVPEGTVPIEAKNVKARPDRPGRTPAAQWKRGAGDVDAGVSAGPDLAAPEPTVAPVPAEFVDATDAQGLFDPADQPAVATPTAELSDPVEVIDRRLEALEPVPTVEPFPDIKPFAARGAVAEPSVAPVTEPARKAEPGPARVPEGAKPLGNAEPLHGRGDGPPKPSWEQPDLFIETPEEPEAESADTGAEQASIPDQTVAPIVDEPDESPEIDIKAALAALEEARRVAENEAVEADQAKQELEVPGVDVQAALAALQEARELEPVEPSQEAEVANVDVEGALAALEEARDLELEEDEEEGDDDELEEDEEEEDDDELEEDEEEEDDDELEEDEEEEDDDELEEDEEEEDDDELEEDEEEEDDDELEEDEEEEELEEEDDEEPVAEDEVVIQPPPVPDAAKIPSQPAVAASGVDSKLLFEAGAHFLKEGRVAVSMLQRTFGLDFDRACELLDELQERGLIGPYLGGQQRDILMSLEQWEELVSKA